MLSDINILPQKEKRSLLFVIIITVIFAFGIVGAIFIFLQYQSIVEDKAAKQTHLEAVIKLREAEEIKLAELSSILTSTNQFQSIVSKVQDIPIATNQVIDSLSALLPQAGYFTSYSYSDAGTVSITTEFESLEDVAGYLHRLTYADWVITVELPNISQGEVYTAPFNIIVTKEAFRPKEGDDS